ncbi:MAG TPA: alpha/beta hydrolase [Verrucomicrobiae bacterium]|nr:alpha/beta hydrolase [Verrucomicrobiae bacterium]
MKTPKILLLLTLISFVTSTSAELIRDVEYAKTNGVSLTLDVNVPEGKGPFPIAILVHGGGFTNVTKEQYITPLFAPLTEANFTWFTINYRGLMSNSYPVWVEDVERSIRWVKAHATEYKGDTNRIALIGESFGGYLVSLAVGRATNDTKVNAAVVFYGPFMDMAAVAKHNGHIPEAQMKAYGIHKIEGSLKILHDASVTTYVRKGLPPFLLIHGTMDTRVPFSVSLDAQKQYLKAGVPCELIAVTNAPHGMVNWEPYDQSYKTKMIEWLEKTLGDGKQ